MPKGKKPLDVWLKFDEPGDEEPSHEANTYLDSLGSYRVEWYNTAVGQVTSRTFTTHEAARRWLEEGGYQDFST
jgi:hypothetical protein